MASAGTQPTGSEQSSLLFLVTMRREIGRRAGGMLTMARDQFSPLFDTSHASCRRALFSRCTHCKVEVEVASSRRTPGTSVVRELFRDFARDFALLATLRFGFEIRKVSERPGHLRALVALSVKRRQDLGFPSSVQVDLTQRAQGTQNIGSVQSRSGCLLQVHVQHLALDRWGLRA